MIALRFAGFRTGMMICYLLLALLLACTSTIPGDKKNAPDIGDGGFLSGEPCGPPCFWGITPGVTTETEATQVFQSKNISQRCKSFNNEFDGGLRGITCNPIISISFRRNSDIVEDVVFDPSSTITVADAITKYGPPTWVLVGVIGLPEEAPQTTMGLYYKTIHAQLGLPMQKSRTYKVEPGIEVTGIVYVDSDEALTRGLHDLPKWNGYGEYKRSTFEK